MRVTYRPIEGDWQGERSSWTTRKRTPFKASWERTLSLLDRELMMLGASEVVFQLDMSERDIRLDGYPRRDARPRSPAVILSFKSRHGWLRYQCDVFEGGAEGWQDNVRAIALGLEALRQVERYGITKRGEQYTGWKALPDGKMTREEGLRFIYEQAGGTSLITGGVHTDVAYRLAAKKLHPDVGGSREDWDKLQRAKEAVGL